MSAIGPELPPHLRHLSQRAPSDEEEESDDDYAPTLPPDMVKPASSKAEPSLSVPARPSSRVNTVQYLAEDSDDEDIGPKPSASAPAAADPVAEFIAREERRKERLKAEEEEKKKGPKREEWMLVPPSSGDLLGTLDPSKLNKPRQFARTTPVSHASSSNDGSGRNSVPSLWTETPAERQQRLADEVMGRKRPANRVGTAEEESLENKRRRLAEEDVRRGVEDHTRRVRGAALVDAHIEKEKTKRAKGGEEEEKDLGIWDHGRDMALSGRLMDDSQRNKLIRDAKSLGDRFGSGKSGFL
ncbi:hypothetical protein D9757_006741 [Collybiopsis confluens]|uniref:DUF3752 domain-containing protein n=1 Tax=Collybiopsis confluens TaxID=2823264 RepID=A0A8H5HLM1_9AGAR|nr:hypothetical protein D9757_006741 [Collybiopsis confluens]